MRITKSRCRGINLVSYSLLVFLLHFSVKIHAQKIAKDSILTYKTIGYHPSLSKEELPEQTILYNKNTHKFSSIVESVICKTNVCKIVDVDLFWNEIGNYDSYRLYGKDYLEKDKGIPFTSKDTAKLDAILHDESSELRGVDIGKIEDYNPSDVDAVTGATIVIQDDQIVKGAAWTCYTLWHWVYGNLRDKVKEISSSMLSVDRLVSFLSKGTSYRLFALESLKNRGIHTKEIDSVLKDSLTYYQQTSYRYVLDYYKSVLKTKPAAFSKKMLSMYQNGDKNKKLQTLYAVQDYNGLLEIDFYNTICPNIIKENEYQEIYTFLEILGAKKINSPIVSANLLTVLKNDNFLISRSAYWYLKDKEDLLSKKQYRKVKKFYRKNKKRL